MKNPNRSVGAPPMILVPVTSEAGRLHYLPEILRIYHEAFDEASREPDERLLAEMNGEYRLSFRFLVAKDGDRVVGFARFCAIPETNLGFLIHIAIDPDSRGGGRGTALLQQVIAELAPRPVLVEVDREGPVRDWYERQGFVLVSETYTQPALHSHTPPVPYALVASALLSDPHRAIRDFYQIVWELGPDDPIVLNALDGITEVTS